MEQKPKSKKTLLILIPVALILIAGAVFGILYFPAQKSYRSALTAAQDSSIKAARKIQSAFFVSFMGFSFRLLYRCGARQ